MVNNPQNWRENCTCHDEWVNYMVNLHTSPRHFSKPTPNAFHVHRRIQFLILPNARLEHWASPAFACCIHDTPIYCSSRSKMPEPDDSQASQEQKVLSRLWFATSPSRHWLCNLCRSTYHNAHCHSTTLQTSGNYSAGDKILLEKPQLQWLPKLIALPQTPHRSISLPMHL